MTTNDIDCRRTALSLVAGTLWYSPRSFSMARFLGPSYSLRCVLFHDVSDVESSFTKGLGVTVTRKQFEAALRFVTRHYTPVSLQDVITDSDGRGLPARPVLVTFDDAYSSVSEFAAPLCSQFGVPAVFFVNSGCLDNRQLALENLICHVKTCSDLTQSTPRFDCRGHQRPRGSLADTGLLSFSSSDVSPRQGGLP